MSRMTSEEALDLIQNADLLELGKMASERKKELHPKGITTFVVDRNINYTNVCWVDCKFCAFYRHAKDDDAYVLSHEEIDKKIDELLVLAEVSLELFPKSSRKRVEIARIYLNLGVPTVG